MKKETTKKATTKTTKKDLTAYALKTTSIASLKEAYNKKDITEEELNTILSLRYNVKQNSVQFRAFIKHTFMQKECIASVRDIRMNKHNTTKKKLSFFKKRYELIDKKLCQYTDDNASILQLL